MEMILTSDTVMRKETVELHDCARVKTTVPGKKPFSINDWIALSSPCSCSEQYIH